MASYKLTFAFIFAIKLAINVVPSLASSNEPQTPRGKRLPAPFSYQNDPRSPIITETGTPIRPPPPPILPLSPFVSETGTPIGPPPPPLLPPTPELKGKSSPFFIKAKTPIRSPSASIRPPSPPTRQPTPSTKQPAPSTRQPTPRTRPASPPTRPPSPRTGPPVADKSCGEYSFGEWSPNERLIVHKAWIHRELPDERYIAPYDGRHGFEVIIHSPNYERITRIELKSVLEMYCGEEEVHNLGYTDEEHKGIRLRFVSRKYFPIHYTLNMYTH